MENLKRTCVFCGSGNLTREHIFPDWMSKLLDPKLTATITKERDGKVESKFTTRAFRQKAKIVCSVCNNGWMSRLESDAKPLLKPMMSNLNYKVNLGKEEQGILAFWAQKTAMILSIAATPDYVVPSDFFRTLFKAQSAIDNITVRLGWRVPKSNVNGQHLSFFTISQITGPIPPEYQEVLKKTEAWKAIIAIGNLVFHLNGFTPDIRIEIGNNDTRVTPQIMPFAKMIDWPTEWPVDALTSGGFKEFSKV